MPSEGSTRNNLIQLPNEVPNKVQVLTVSGEGGRLLSRRRASNKGVYGAGVLRHSIN